MSAPERVWVCYDPRYEHLNAVSADESRASHMRQMDESLYEYVLASSYDALRAERDALRNVALDERAKIVKWLRRDRPMMDAFMSKCGESDIAAIERGAHLEDEHG